MAIRVLRAEQGISARKLAALAGLSPSYVSKVEAGQIEPSFRGFSAIATVLRMSQAEIMFLVQTTAERNQCA
jgi:transcriptional regulator with XRE-family HTH domain